MLRRTFHYILIVFFIGTWIALLPGRLAVPAVETFSSDAEQYHGAAVHFAESGFYSLDGETPYLEREPGYSFFLGLVYFIFGTGNRIAVFAMQGLLYLVASLVFASAFRRIATERIALICLFLLLTFPPAFHAIFSAYRESIALSMFLLLAALLIHFLSHPRFVSAVIGGILIGYIILVYVPFLFLPIFLFAALTFLRIGWKHTVTLCVLPFLVVALWGARNYIQAGEFRIVGSFRTTAMLHARAEQAKQLHGLDPLRCLWAEYVSRDWSSLPAACSTNAMILAKWPQRVPTQKDDQIAKESKAVILQYFPSYLRFSLFEILELHIPFVNGWGFVYNVFAVLATAVLYVGCIVCIGSAWRKEYAIFLAVMAYATAIFILTDAMPRYLLPVIFCYVVFAAVGYDRILARFMRS